MSEGLETYYPLGLILLGAGLVLLLVPFIAKHAPTVEALAKLPPLLVYVYRSGDFVFVTSPLLIVAALIYLFWRLAT